MLIIFNSSYIMMEIMEFIPVSNRFNGFSDVFVINAHVLIKDLVA